MLSDDRPFELPNWAARLLDPAIAAGVTLVLAGIGVSSSLRALAVGSLLVIPYLAGTIDGRDGLVRVAFEEVVIVAAWLAGESVRARRQYVAQLQARATYLERER